MATNKQNLSDLLREEAQQEKAAIHTEPAAENMASTQKTVPKALSRMTKAELMAHIQGLYERQGSQIVSTPEDHLTEKETLTNQVKTLEAQIATQKQAIASAETTIKTLQADSSEKESLADALAAQKSLVKTLYSKIQILEEARQAPPQTETRSPKQERTLEEDRSMVLARIASYQVNLQFPSQPPSSIPEEQIGWFD